MNTSYSHKPDGSAEQLLEDQKNELLAALYDIDYKTAESVFHQILRFTQNQQNFPENFEKRLRQILIIFKRFKSHFIHHCSPEINNTYNRFKQIVSDSTRKTTRFSRIISFKTWEAGIDLTQNQKKLLYKTVMTFQLSSGCSNYCRRCNEWALPGVRSHFSFNAITRILRHIANEENTEVSLYGASDPLDWVHGERDISDIIDMAKQEGIDYSLLTKLPRGKKKLLKKLIQIDANLSVSMTNKNKNKILNFEQAIGHPISKQHDTDDLLIPAGLDEDFVSVKPSITDGYGCEITPEGAYIIIPTFTSALYPFGHAKIPVTKRSSFFPQKKIGRKALLVDYFKPLKGYDKNRQHVHLDTLLPVQVESILLDNGSDALTPPGMRSMKEYFSIFGEKARVQRKKMTPSVIKKLKKQPDFQQKIQAHLDMCHPKSCSTFKLFSISYFLNAIAQYTNHTRLKIILFLLKKEQKESDAHPFSVGEQPSIKALISDHRLDSFNVFRWLVFQLITQPHKTGAIQSFIKKHPATYDPAIDLFISQKQPQC